MGALFVASITGTLVSARYPSGHEPGWLSASLGLLFLGAFAMVLLSAAAQLYCWFAPARYGSVSVVDGRLQITRTNFVRTLSREQVSTGWVLREGKGALVELRLKSGEHLSFDVASLSEGEAILDAIDLGADDRALSVELGSPLFNIGIALGSIIPSSCIAAMVVNSLERWVPRGSATLGFLMFAMIAAGMPVAIALFSRPHITVGRDGVSFKRGPFSWFVSFHDLARVEIAGTLIILHEYRGSMRYIATAGSGASQRQALVDRIQAGIDKTFSRRDLSARVALLDRAGRSIEAWTDALRALAQTKDAFRTTALSGDELISVIDDPLSPPERRVAAAYVLALRDRERAVQRVRVALESTANERVRVALERASNGTLDEQTLREVADERLRVQ
jgi:hypothetical protein